MITQSLTVKKESHSDRFLEDQQIIYAIIFGFQEFLQPKGVDKELYSKMSQDKSVHSLQF